MVPILKGNLFFKVSQNEAQLTNESLITRLFTWEVEFCSIQMKDITAFLMKLCLSWWTRLFTSLLISSKHGDRRSFTVEQANPNAPAGSFKTQSSRREQRWLLFYQHGLEFLWAIGLNEARFPSWTWMKSNYAFVNPQNKETEPTWCTDLKNKYINKRTLREELRL